MSGHVFVSYSRDDRAYVANLAEFLGNSGVRTEWDYRIETGAVWPVELAHMIEECAAFIVVMTPAAHDSDWVQREVIHALQHKKTIIPLLLDGAPFFTLNDRNYESVSAGAMPSAKIVERLRALAAPDSAAAADRESEVAARLATIAAERTAYSRRSNGRIITFFSNTGGAGRTMAMANVAWLLASTGNRVLAVDWDLESPGLHRYFHPFLNDQQLRHSAGIIELIRHYTDMVDRVGSAETIESLTQIQEYAISLEWDFPRGGVIDFVPAGRPGDAYARTVGTFDWDVFWDRQGRRFVEVLGEGMREHYDFALINSAIGMSESASICTLYLPDAVVNCFTLNTQSIDGAAAVTNGIQDRLEGRVTVYPVPTRIDDREKERLGRGRRYARGKLSPLLTFLDGEGADAYWDGVEVPYAPQYAYEEILAAFGDDNVLLPSYQRLATWITGADAPRPAINESERARIRRQYEGATPGEQLTIMIAYAPLDRIWAEWLRDRFAGAADIVTLRGIQKPLASLDGVGRLIVVHSRDFANYEEGDRLLRLAAERAAASDERFLGALRVDAMPVSERVPARSLINVMGVGEEQALERLTASLELDPVPLPRPDGVAIRYPRDPTPHWNVRLVRNSRFSGRGALLEQVRDELLGAGPAGGRLALTGLPGMGKTQIALEYAYRFAASYRIVWWISASWPPRNGLSDLAAELRVARGQSLDEQVAAVLEELRRAEARQPWLIVFDGAQAPDSLEELMPSGPGHVLVTSRDVTWADRMAQLEIAVFQRGESIEVLGRQVPGVATNDAERVAERLGDLPFAIEQAGAWLNAKGLPVRSYLDMLDHSTAEALNVGALAGYTSTVRMAFDTLRTHDPAAAHVLTLFAFMAPEPIPFRLLSNRRLAEVLTRFDAKMADPMRHGTLTGEMSRAGLAQIDPATGSVVVHRLTQDIVRSALTPQQQEEGRAELQSLLAAAERGNPDDREKWATYEALRPHLAAAGALSSPRPDTRQLVIDMASYLWQSGDDAACEDLAGSALAEWLPMFGPDDPWTLQLQYQRGVALRHQAREAEAYELNRDSFERLRRMAGPGDPYTLRAASSIGADLRVRGEYHQARALDETTVARLRAALGDNPPLTLDAVSGFGASMRMMGEFAEAARLDHDTLDRRRRLFGADDLGTLTAAGNYAIDLRELGDLAGSLGHLETAYQSVRGILGDEHRRTIELGKSYAMTLRRLGRYSEAEVIDRVVASAGTSFGPRHPATLACRMEQAGLRWAEGRPGTSLAIAEDVYQEYQRLRGDHHPVTLAVANNLCIFRRAVGDVDGGRRLAEVTAEWFANTLGPNHPNTLASVVTVANALYTAGKLNASRQKDDEVYHRLRRVWDSQDHPAILAAEINCAVSHRTYEPATAAQRKQHALDRVRATLGEDHPHLTAARELRRVDLDIEIPII